MEFQISVIICTHNPKSCYLDRVLDALNQQTLDFSLWELLLIDNASKQPLSSQVGLGWHPFARHIREEELGLTSARLRGIREAQAEVLVFVDDDNVLDRDFLEIALKISKDYSFIGAWGGQIKPEFEVDPPEWTKPYWGYLAISEFKDDRWSNLVNQHETTPCGAGLCIRKWIAQEYASILSNNATRRCLDRRGTTLSSCGDSDLAFTACDLGLGIGKFAALKLIHLIPACRIKEDYLLRLSESITYSWTILKALRGELSTSRTCLSEIIYQRYKLWRMNPRQRRFLLAQQSGKKLAEKEIAKW